MIQKYSPPPSRRQRNVEARRQRILDAARSLIDRDGVSGLTMRKLAEHAGFSPTTLYNLFGGRDQILEALVFDLVHQFDEILEREAPLDDPLDRCRAIITVSIRDIAAEESIFRPVFQALYQGISVGRVDGSEVAEIGANMQQVAIEKAIEAGLLRDTLDPAVLAWQVFHGYDLACSYWAFGLIDADGFRAQALYGLYVALLGVVTDERRPDIERQLHALERELAAHYNERSSKRSKS